MRTKSWSGNTNIRETNRKTVRWKRRHLAEYAYRARRRACQLTSVHLTSAHSLQERNCVSLTKNPIDNVFSQTCMVLGVTFKTLTAVMLQIS
jgi:hypothetical protein